MSDKARYSVGDKVRVCGYEQSINGKMGWITKIDGEYVYVRLRWQPIGREIELYRCELERIEK